MPRAVGGPVEAVEYVRVVGGVDAGVDAGAVVADGDPASAHAHLDEGAIRAPLAGVVHEVGDGPLQGRRMSSRSRFWRASVARSRRTLCGWPYR